MKKKSTEREVESSPTWEELEAFARQGVQRLLQRVVIWETLVIAEQRFQRLNAPELLLEVAEGTVYVDGRRVKHAHEGEKKKAAA